MEATGGQEVAPVVRLLLDEALGARRRKSVQPDGLEPPPPILETPDLATIQNLLIKLIEQGDIAFRMQSVNLELLQESLAEARSGRTSLWDYLVAFTLKKEGVTGREIANLFERQSEDAKNFAYGLAEEIKKKLDADLDSIGAPTENDDRQGSFDYDVPDTQETA